MADKTTIDSNFKHFIAVPQVVAMSSGVESPDGIIVELDVFDKLVYSQICQMEFGLRKHQWKQFYTPNKIGEVLNITIEQVEQSITKLKDAMLLATRKTIRDFTGEEAIVVDVSLIQDYPGRFYKDVMGTRLYIVDSR